MTFWLVDVRMQQSPHNYKTRNKSSQQLPRSSLSKPRTTGCGQVGVLLVAGLTLHRLQCPWCPHEPHHGFSCHICFAAAVLCVRIRPLLAMPAEREHGQVQMCQQQDLMHSSGGVKRSLWTAAAVESQWTSFCHPCRSRFDALHTIISGARSTIHNTVPGDSWCVPVQASTSCARQAATRPDLEQIQGGHAGI